jgi:excisionase family DNA binding protein
MNEKLENYPTVLNAAQLAEILNVSKATAYQLLHMESFPTLRIGKRLMVPKEKMVRWIDENSGGMCLGV